jgi:hypothetical protein
MNLVVQEVTHADAAQCIDLRVRALGSLVIGRPPPYAGYMEKAQASIHSDLDGAPHVHHLKVVDSDNESEVIAYGKWEVYLNGRPDLDNLRKPMTREDKEVDQFGVLREAAHAYFCERNGEMGKQPHIREFSVSRRTWTLTPCRGPDHYIYSARTSCDFREAQETGSRESSRQVGHRFVRRNRLALLPSSIRAGPTTVCKTWIPGYGHCSVRSRQLWPTRSRIHDRDDKGALCSKTIALSLSIVSALLFGGV